MRTTTPALIALLGALAVSPAAASPDSARAILSPAAVVETLGVLAARAPQGQRQLEPVEVADDAAFAPRGLVVIPRRHRFYWPGLRGE